MVSRRGPVDENLSGSMSSRYRESDTGVDEEISPITPPVPGRETMKRPRSDRKHHPSMASQERHLQPQDQANRIAQLGINGWWDRCNFNELNPFACSGTFSRTAVFPLDPTGATCYINPLVSNYPAVHFFGTNPDFVGSSLEGDLFLYTIFIRADERDQLFPRDCNYAGLCSCDTIEALRVGFPDVRGWCRPPRCQARASFSFSATKQCNINAKYQFYDAPANATVRVCAMQAGLVDISVPTSAPSMSAQRSPNSGTIHRQGSIYTLLLLCVILSRVLV